MGLEDPFDQARPVPAALATPLPRVVLLGASNVSISLSLILEMLAAAHDGPLELFTAIGHGRSYGLPSRVLLRGLPGIVECGLWDSLARQPAGRGPTRALLTDVGNDLFYGASVPRILEWVEACLARLAEQRAEITLTLLPMASVARLTPTHYHIARTLFFTGKGPTWPEMQRSAAALDAGLLELGRRYGAAVIEPQGDWYGLDPIHLTRANRPRAWQAIFDRWPTLASRTPARRTSFAARLRAWRHRPETEWWLGRLRQTPQPVFRSEKITLRMY